jgi:hypothetical protein
MQVMIVATEGVRERFVTGRSAENPDRDHSAKSRQPEQETGRAPPRGFRSPSRTPLIRFFARRRSATARTPARSRRPKRGILTGPYPGLDGLSKPPGLKFQNNCRDALIVAVACRQLLLKNARNRGAPALLARRPGRRQDVSQKNPLMPIPAEIVRIGRNQIARGPPPSPRLRTTRR